MRPYHFLILANIYLAASMASKGAWLLTLIVGLFYVGGFVYLMERDKES